VVSPDRGTIRIRGRFDQSPVELSVLDSSDSSTPEDLEHEPSKTGIATDVNQMRPNSTPSRLLSLRIFFYNLRFIPYYLWFIPFACCYHVGFTLLKYLVWFYYRRFGEGRNNRKNHI
jgi:hypothetical protein